MHWCCLSERFACARGQVSYTWLIAVDDPSRRLPVITSLAAVLGCVVAAQGALHAVSLDSMLLLLAPEQAASDSAFSYTIPFLAVSSSLVPSHTSI
jgi:hypothetical protein